MRDYDAEVEVVLNSPERHPFSYWVDVFKIRLAQDQEEAKDKIEGERIGGK